MQRAVCWTAIDDRTNCRLNCGGSRNVIVESAGWEPFRGSSVGSQPRFRTVLSPAWVRIQPRFRTVSAAKWGRHTPCPVKGSPERLCLAWSWERVERQDTIYLCLRFFGGNDLRPTRGLFCAASAFHPPEIRSIASASVNRRDGKAPMTIPIVMILCALLLCASTIRGK